MTETTDEIVSYPQQDSEPEPYLPSECINAINETNSKTESMLKLWNDYVSNLKNNTNHTKNIHALNHVQNIGNEELNTHKFLNNKASHSVLNSGL